MATLYSSKILAKLASKVPPVSKQEVAECFGNRLGIFLTDDREDHQSDPPTLWFIAETNFGRKLKIAFLIKDGNVHIRTAYDPNPEEIRIFDKYGR